ncbi:MAG TPA: 9-O-acetyl-N-acetylneuraminate esterase [Lachnospiraceae bacterium]|nr:9-O-acetyl-N-acetylneuraminate esterase [Lachnospiraceae bacterium]
MGKIFNTDGYCDPELHYMVDLTGRLAEIRAMVDAGKYFTVNRARQYGKTTVLTALADALADEYEVVSMDFQTLSSLAFKDEQSFVAAFSEELLDLVHEIPVGIREKLIAFAEKNAPMLSLQMLFKALKAWCRESGKKIVLIIDEVDTAANNQVFLDFLAQLRAYYLKRRRMPTFQSVILAGVYDVRNIRRKIRPDDEHKENSPWNIASDFLVEMSFSIEDIEGMLGEYEADHHTGMDIYRISKLLYEYTSGYPYLVSRLCKLMDERIAGKAGCMGRDRDNVWTEEGCRKAVKMLLEENNPLFDSLINKVNQFPELKAVIRRQLFQGLPVAYAADDAAVRNARMFGLVKMEGGNVQIANRIFETRLYNYFLTMPEAQEGDFFQLASLNKNQFVCNGRLDMAHILEKFVEHFDDIYGGRDQKFYEEDGRRYFMLYLKPIINGVGNYYVEAQTRDQERTDLVIDYCGVQYIVELKIWRGNAYNERGEKQLIEYLDYYHLNKGYMLSFNFNKKKEIGLKEVVLGDKILVEAVV